MANTDCKTAAVIPSLLDLGGETFSESFSFLAFFRDNVSENLRRNIIYLMTYFEVSNTVACRTAVTTPGENI